MAVNTVLFDFSVDPKSVSTETQLTQLATNIENILRDHLQNLKQLSSFFIDSGLFKLYSSDFGTVSNIRVFGNGIITVNIEYYKADKQEPLLSFEVMICGCGPFYRHWAAFLNDGWGLEFDS